MLFLNTKHSFLNKIKNKKKYNNSKTLRNLFSVKNSYPLNYFQLFFYLPGNWDFLLLTKSNLKTTYIYNSVYFFRFPIPYPSTKVNFNKNTSIIAIENLYPNNFYKLYWIFLNSVFSSLNKPFFLKLKFKGKGYYIYKNKRNTITPQFGYAHRIYLYAYYVTVKFLSKTSILVFGFSKKDVYMVSNSIKSMRPINIFTGRGVRFSREIIYRKQGKVSSYR